MAGPLCAFLMGPALGDVLQPFTSASDSVPAQPWRFVGLPSQKEPLTDYAVVNLGGQRVLRIHANKSYSNLVHALPPQTMAETLSWRWRLDRGLDNVDLRHKDGDDVALKVCAMFDMPLERLGFVERNLMRLARNLSGEQLPAATLCYVWDAHMPSGTELVNAFSKRLHYLVLNSGTQEVGQWLSHSRDLRADFLQSFGAESSTVPPLLAIAVGADADNTGGESLAYIGSLSLMKQSAQ